MKPKNDERDQSLSPTRLPWAGPIEVFVSYHWEKEEGTEGERVGKSVRKDQNWIRLRKLVTSVVNSVARWAEGRPGQRSLEIRVNRLRGSHGMALLSVLRERIKKADILIVDLGSDDPRVASANVLLELGMALSEGKSEQGRLFILKPSSMKRPSDLDGLLFTEYKMPSSQQDSLHLVDRVGFDAALRSRLLGLARERYMLGDLGTPPDLDNGSIHLTGLGVHGFHVTVNKDSDRKNGHRALYDRLAKCLREMGAPAPSAPDD